MAELVASSSRTVRGSTSASLSAERYPALTTALERRGRIEPDSPLGTFIVTNSFALETARRSHMHAHPHT